jgi:hypothetical protein
VIGFMYGKGTIDGSQAFCLPDYRGLFLRGVDARAGLDSQATERVAPTGSGTSGAVGSLQCDAFQEHNHNYDVATPSGLTSTGTAAAPTTRPTATGKPNAPARFGPETRPRNIYVNYIIKYR